MSFTYSDPNINVNNANLVIAGASNKLRTPKVEFTDGTFLTSGLGVTNNLELIASIGNVTSNTLQFLNPTTAFVTGADSNVGIGLSDPERLLHVGSRTTGGQIRLSTYAPYNGDQTLTSNLSILSLTGGRTASDGTLAAVQENDILGQFALSGANGPNGYNEGFRIRSTATGDWNTSPPRRCETTFNQRTGDGISNSSFTEIMKISSEGDIGIGTSTPSYPLHVYGNTAIAIENDAQPRIDFLSSQFGSGPGSNVNLLIHRIGPGGDNFGNCFSIRRTASGTGKINISTEDDTVNMLNLKSNNVGVGTMTPATRLHVAGTTDFDASQCTLRIEDTDPDPDSAKPKLEFYGAGSQMYSISGESQLSGENFLLFSDSSGNPSMALNSAKDLIKVDGALPNDLGKFSEGIQNRATSSSGAALSLNCYDPANTSGTLNSARIVFRAFPTGSVDDHTSVDVLDGRGIAWFDYRGIVSGSETRLSLNAIYRDGSGTKQVFNTTNSGNDCLVLRSSGNVGIGTDDPKHTLHINTGTLGLGIDVINQPSGSIIFDNNSGGTAVPNMVSKSTNNTGLVILTSTPESVPSKYDVQFNVVNNSNNPHETLTSNAYTFKVGGYDKLVIHRNGNVGIGTNAPTFKLDVKHDGTGGVRLNGGSPGDGLYIRNQYVGSGETNFAFLGQPSFSPQNGGGLQLFNIAGTEKVRFNNNGNSFMTGGNLGIGTTGPRQKLHIENGIIESGSDASTAGSTILVGKYSGSSYLTVLGSQASSGASCLGYATKPKPGVRYGFLSSAGNAGLARGLLAVDQQLTYYANANSTLVSTDSDVVMEQKFRVDSSGNVLIGSIAPGNNTVNSKLVVKTDGGTIPTDSGYAVAIGTDRYGLILETTASTTDGAAAFWVKNENSAVGTIIRCSNNGNVGIGTGSADQRLSIGAGPGLADWRFYGVANDFIVADPVSSIATRKVIFKNSGSGATLTVDVQGTLTKTSGSFKIDHPLKDTHHLVHSFVESPQANNIYRGKVQLENGQAIVNLDEVSTMTEGTFVLLNRDIHVYTTNETDWDAVRGRVEGNLLTIECQNTGSTATVSWLVIGERQDKHMYDTTWTDENGKVIVEPLKKTNDNNENEGTDE